MLNQAEMLAESNFLCNISALIFKLFFEALCHYLDL